MIIQTSNVHMSAEHQKTEYSSQTKMIDWGSEGNAFLTQLSEAKSFLRQEQSSLFSTLAVGQQPSTEGDDQFQGNSVLVLTDQGLQFRTADNEPNIAEQREITKARLWQSLLNAINPKHIQTDIPDDVEIPDADSIPSEDGIGGIPMQLQPIKMEMSFKVTETVEEYECSSFHSCGMVTTADGKQIEFDLNLEMERSYSATREFEMTSVVEFTDPLILNFEGNHADLSDEKFEFDLDADGDKELISYLTGESGMLALDKNEDGIINDGTELFGALTGNGFADLAQYDEDGNNYIDEGDSIFDDLLVWHKTEDSDYLESLADSGVGAIYLGSTETPFDIKGENNQENGRVRSSGFYLTEAGDVGTVQQIDMAV
ncbi:hypothetical protein [Neptuniibacter sp. QD57_21]|uniref:hypothetical protein n=1 Tax=Neptuniibacter sp. QD57_21 TaxID=3398213 RepID=UPI0039F478B5